MYLRGCGTAMDACCTLDHGDRAAYRVVVALNALPMTCGLARSAALVLVLLVSTTAHAQQPAAARNEVNVAVGGMRIVQDDAGDASSSWGGVGFARETESGAGAFFVTYEHFRRSYPGDAQRFHAVAAGWRFQMRRPAVRPFVEVGWVVASQQSGREDEAFHGPGAAAGLTVRLRAGLFVRPQVRLKILGPGPLVTTQGGVAVGWQF